MPAALPTQRWHDSPRHGSSTTASGSFSDTPREWVAWLCYACGKPRATTPIITTYINGPTRSSTTREKFISTLPKPIISTSSTQARCCLISTVPRAIRNTRRRWMYSSSNCATIRVLMSADIGTNSAIRTRCGSMASIWVRPSWRSMDTSSTSLSGLMRQSSRLLYAIPILMTSLPVCIITLGTRAATSGGPIRRQAHLPTFGDVA